MPEVSTVKNSHLKVYQTYNVKMKKNEQCKS